MGFEKEIKHITDVLVGKISSKQDHYSPTDLIKTGVPASVVEYIRYSLEVIVMNDLRLPESKWVDFDQKLIDAAWSDFVNTAISHSHIPSSSLKSLLNRAIADLFPIFVQPRANLAPFLFGENEELGYEELVAKTSHLTVYKHFASAIPLYMKKRGLETMTLKRCNVLIHNLDEKLVSTYTNDSWGQKLDFLFRLYDDEVDTEILSLYFKDKKLDQVASYFSDLEGTLSKSEFTQILKNPEDVQEIRKKKAPKKKKEETINEQLKQQFVVDEEEQGLIDSFFGNYEYTPIEVDEEDTETLADRFKGEVVSTTEVDELVHEIQVKQSSDEELVTEKDDGDSLNSIFDGAEKGKKDSKDSISSASISSLIERAAHSLQDLEEETPEEPVAEPEKEEVVMEVTDSGDINMAPEPVSETDSGDPVDSDQETQPTWQQFLTSDHIDMVMGGKGDSEEEGDESNSAKSQSELYNYLIDDKDNIVDQLFLGAEYAYDEAIDDLSNVKDWKAASEYIQQSIFERNGIEMTSEIAVEFTDKLQSFYKK